MRAPLIIRAEDATDIAAVRRVNELSFETPSEANLVDQLRRQAHPYISLVAANGHEIVGHIFFSPVSINGEADAAMGLAPMAVLPEFQRRGIGGQLVRQGLIECHHLGFDIVAVLGHPEYYPRFGFAPASNYQLRSEYDVPDEVFMVAELKPGALAKTTGLVRYHPEFANV